MEAEDIYLAAIRVSTDKQDASAEEQVKVISKHFAARGIDMKNVRIYVDENVSARLIPLQNRPEGGKLYQDVDKYVNLGYRVKVIATALNRLFRDSVDGITCEKKWTAMGVPILLIEMGGNSIDTSTALGRFLFRQLLSWSEAEADITAERTKTALSARRRDGSATSQAHWGTEFDVNGKDKTLRWISTTHRAVVYYIKQTRARKNISFETIAADVNDMFLKDSNTKITKDTANRIYKNQAYDRIK